MGRDMNLEDHDFELASNLEARGAVKLKADWERCVDLLNDVGLFGFPRFLRVFEVVFEGGSMVKRKWRGVMFARDGLRRDARFNLLGSSQRGIYSCRAMMGASRSHISL